MFRYPLLIEATELEKHLNDEDLLIVDLCKKATYDTNHIPGAVHCEYSKIVKVEKPIVGLVPDDTSLIELFSSLGIAEPVHVIAYDDEGGGNACRFMWILELLGHKNLSLLNGGIFSWANNGFPLSKIAEQPTPAQFEINKDASILVSLNYIQDNLKNEQIQLLDSRSAAEFQGTKAFALRGGHIPGAIHYEWTDAMDRNNNLCMRPIKEIQQVLMDKGFSKDKTIVAYCHSHHRSSFSYYVLKLAGFKNIKAYAGSWSEWGNHPDTEVRTGE